jgi:AbrB family looped-hinge helix DNA binding protein
MSIVTVKNKYQVVIPQSVRNQVAVRVGDLFEATVERGKITLTPKSIVDRAVAEGLEDLRKGHVSGPFGSVDMMLASMKGKQKQTVTKAKPRASRPTRILL